MKDGVARKLGRPTAHRWAMLRTMVSQLITHERMETTVAKARGRRRRAANGRRHEAQAAAASTRAFSKHPRRWLCDAHPAAQAKEVRRIADHMVSLGKDGSLAARRRAAAVVRGQDVLRKLFSELSSRYAARVGGCACSRRARGCFRLLLGWFSRLTRMFRLQTRACCPRGGVWATARPWRSASLWGARGSCARPQHPPPRRPRTRPGRRTGGGCGRGGGCGARRRTRRWYSRLCGAAAARRKAAQARRLRRQGPGERRGRGGG